MCRQGWGQQQAQHRSGHASPWAPTVETRAPMSVVYEFIVLQEILSDLSHEEQAEVAWEK